MNPWVRFSKKAVKCTCHTTWYTRRFTRSSSCLGGEKLRVVPAASSVKDADVDDSSEAGESEAGGDLPRGGEIVAIAGNEATGCPFYLIRVLRSSEMAAMEDSDSDAADVDGSSFRAQFLGYDPASGITPFNASHLLAWSHGSVHVHSKTKPTAYKTAKPSCSTFSLDDGVILVRAVELCKNKLSVPTQAEIYEQLPQVLKDLPESKIYLASLSGTQAEPSKVPPKRKVQPKPSPQPSKPKRVRPPPSPNHADLQRWGGARATEAHWGDMYDRLKSESTEYDLNALNTYCQCQNAFVYQAYQQSNSSD